MGKLISKFNKLVALMEKHTGKRCCISRPNFVHFLTQYECNYNCEFCGFDYRTRPLMGQLGFDEFKVMLGHLHPESLTGLVFSGMGEPLLCRDFEKIIMYVRERHPHIKLMINTNGELLCGDRLRFAAAHLDNVVISLHSLDPATYGVISGNKSLETVLENIRGLRGLNPGLALTFYFAYSMRNIAEICKHVDFCLENGNSFYIGAYAKFYSYRRCFSALDDERLYFTLDRDLSLFRHQEYSDGLVMEAMKHASEAGLRKYIFPPLFSNKSKKRVSCSFPYEQTMVGPNGMIYPCGGSEVLMYEDIRDGRLDFGNILTEDIDKIWNKRDYQRLRRSSLGGCECRDMEYCENCSTLSFLLNTGNIEKSHFVENSQKSNEGK